MIVGTKKNKELVFANERGFLLNAEQVKNGTPEYMSLVREYKKLLRQSERLVDMSDRQQLELIELNEIKNKFVGMAAHDLRNPAALISGFSEVILSDPEMLLDERNELLTIINGVSEEMLTLLGDLLDVSAIESGKLSFSPTEGRLDQMVEKRVNLLQNIADQKNILITQKLDSITAVFDADRMGQALDNLIGNAIKFSKSDTEITVTAEHEGDDAVIKVTDQGPGIPANEVDKVFRTFERLSVKPTGTEKSHGLGMAIVKKIVGVHKGHIDLESTIGKGTTFRVRIPKG